MLSETNPHYVVALSGGIASGKSTAASTFKALGISVYDADIAAREVIHPGQRAHREILSLFGDKFLGANGELNRAALRERVFTCPPDRVRLEKILHPEIRSWLQTKVRSDRGPYCVIAIPLLAENWPQYSWADRVLIIDTPPDLQLERLIDRDGVSKELARSILSAQTTRSKRLEIADDVIENTGSPQNLCDQITALHEIYLRLAHKKLSALG